MSLDFYSEETGRKPDVEFIVNLEDGGSRTKAVPAHKYLLAIASPVFKEQFYGRIEYKTGNTSVERIELDVNACVAEAFIAIIYQKPVGSLCWKDTLQLKELCERYEVDQLGDYAKECFAKLKHENEDWETMREFLWNDVCVMSTEDQDDIMRQIWEEDQEMARWQCDKEENETATEDQREIEKEMWDEDGEDDDDELFTDSSEKPHWLIGKGLTDEEKIKHENDFWKRFEEETWNDVCVYLASYHNEREAIRREVYSWNRKWPKKKSTAAKKPYARCSQSEVDLVDKYVNRCTNVSNICRNQKKRKCSFNLCASCCKKQDQVCRGHPRK